MEKGPPPEGGDRDRGPTLMGIIWTQTALVTTIIVLRLYSRLLIRKVGWDDWLMLLTVALYIASAIFAALQDSVGGYRHVYYLSEDATMYALEMNFILRGVHILSLGTGKASVGALILRVIGKQRIWQRWILWGVISFTLLVNVLNCLFNFIQCMPVEANWNRQVEGNCWDGTAQLKFAYFMSTENCVADAVLAIIPATFISRLHMSRRRRINLSILLGLGSMAMICGIVKITELGTIVNDPDFTWGEYALTIWGLSEVFVIIMCGSIPALKPLWDRLFGKSKKSEIGSSSEGTSGERHPMRNVYQARLGSVSCQIGHETINSSEDNQSWYERARSIRATTCIEVISSQPRGKGFNDPLSNAA